MNIERWKAFRLIVDFLELIVLPIIAGYALSKHQYGWTLTVVLWYTGHFLDPMMLNARGWKQ